MASAKARGTKLGRRPGQRIKSDRLAPEVLAMVAQGVSYRRIGRELNLDKDTVGAIVKRNREKRSTKSGVASAEKSHQRRTPAWRRARVVELRRKGLSLRSIAAEMKIGHSTVAREIRAFEATRGPITVEKVERIELWLRVENNNKWVRGKKRSIEEIETFVLGEFEFEKTHYDAWRLRGLTLKRYV